MFLAEADKTYSINRATKMPGNSIKQCPGMCPDRQKQWANFKFAYATLELKGLYKLL